MYGIYVTLNTKERRITIVEVFILKEKKSI